MMGKLRQNKGEMDMRSLQDAVYNWLSIKIVADHRPEDTAARETTAMFYDILKSDFNMEQVDVYSDEEKYVVDIQTSDEKKTYHFPRELIDSMIEHINREPEKFKNYDE